nr:hypothetical protein [Amylibacter marinus]
MIDFTLTPALATLIFVIACYAGFSYRRTWKREGPRYQYWIFGALAAVGFAILAFVPMSVAG